jgi:hypothetical protein
VLSRIWWRTELPAGRAARRRGVDVAAGDSAWFDASLPHTYGNPGRATATFTLAVLEPA